MKLLELEITNVRGIVHLPLKPGERNLVVWGPNGSGKSAVVDAIDFLLTGRISRLTGAGTGDLTLNRHGPHIDHRPEEASVRAVVKLHGLYEPVEIARTMEHPGTLQCNPAALPYLQPVVDLARRGQHVLTRREILKYITAESGARAVAIQHLLKIEEIEDIRKSLVRVANDLEKECQAASRAVSAAEGTVCATVQKRPPFRDSVVLQVVNQNRAVLGGQPVSGLNPDELKDNLTPPTVVSTSDAPNVTLLERDLQNLRDVETLSSQAEVAKIDGSLRETIAALRSDTELLKAFRRLELTRMGLSLIDEIGSCPLCDTIWPPGELSTYLQQRVGTAQVAIAHQDRVGTLSKALLGRVDSTISSVPKGIAAAQAVGLEMERVVLEAWLRDLTQLATSLASPLETYPSSQTTLELVQRMLAPDNIAEVVGATSKALAAKFPKTSAEQTAWDTLTRLEENLRSLKATHARVKEAQASAQRATILLEGFLSARNSILGSLYDSIRDRFVDLYRQLHEADESRFSAILAPQGAGLDFEVDFYGRGSHPPHALHSEGHQDSMGLCLYLALCERLTKGVIDLVILDDVVMSVDSDHRRQLCHLLATSFPERQFLITTHDRTWASQLRSESVVTKQCLVEFYNWHVDSGPQVNFESDMWERLEDDLERGDVPAAAARLRRGSEAFFATVCESLQAPVVFKQNGRYELGDLVPPALREYGELLRAAKRSGNSWNRRDAVERLVEIETVAKSVFSRSNAERWAVNASVHYNDWADLADPDFRPVVDAFHDLYRVFLCSTCDGVLYRVKSGPETVGVRCNCGAVSWNLVSKEKDQ